VSIFQIYRALGTAFGINILFDPNLKRPGDRDRARGRDRPDALETLMRAAGHFYKVIDEHTIIIAADTPQNRRNLRGPGHPDLLPVERRGQGHDDHPAQLIDARRDRHERAAQRHHPARHRRQGEGRRADHRDQRQGAAEVVIDVELLQLTPTSCATWASCRALGVLDHPEPGHRRRRGRRGIRFSDLEFLNQSNWILSLPSFIYNFVKTSPTPSSSPSRSCASARARRRGLVIGDRVPIPVTTFNTANTVGSQHRADHLVPVPGRRHHDRHRAAGAPQPGDHAQAPVEVSNISGFIGLGAASSSRSSAPAPSSRPSACRTARPTSSPA
jgi:hypothetical protein